MRLECIAWERCLRKPKAGPGNKGKCGSGIKRSKSLGTFRRYRSRNFRIHLCQWFTVVREIGGHGVGLEFHEEPWVSHIGTRGTDMLLVPGMIFTIEPMVNAGKPDVVQDDNDGWTIYTKDGSLSAQWEYTVLITEDGPEVLAR